MYVADSMETARREAEEGIMSIFQYNDPYRGTQVFMNPGEKPDPDAKLSWDFLEPRTLLVGSADHIIERLDEHEEICDLDEILIGYAHHRVPQKKTLKNLELFATRIIPHFEKRARANAAAE
jgi:alkanesulfonate monooxygenase SsuD/methylene tetrahydromethanopterin reductase-like flavin-dependent oxidoreductase (luciferase family)